MGRRRCHRHRRRPGRHGLDQRGAGDSWRERARLGTAPHAVAADLDAGRIAVVTEDGLLESTDGGGTFTLLLVA